MTVIKKEIRSKLADDATYISLLGSPSGEPYKTYYVYPPTVPDFPFVVFALRPGVVSDEFDKTLVVKRVDLTFNVWSRDDTYETIADRIKYLLHQYGNENGFRIVYDRERSELYDKETNAYGVNIAFNLFSRQGMDIMSLLLDHGDLLGLLNDTHLQYLLASGSRVMTGSLNLGEFDLINPGAGHDLFTDFILDEHIAHSGVNINSGGILSGGGDITTDRTISLAQADIDHGLITGLLHDDHLQYLLIAGTRAMTGNLKWNGNGTLDIGSDGTGFKKAYIGNDKTSQYALPDFRGLSFTYANGDCYIGNDNYFPGYYVQKTVQHGSTANDASTDYTNLYQGNSDYPNLTLMYEIEYTGSNAVYIGDNAAAPVPLIFRNTSLGFKFQYDQPNNKFIMESQGLQTAFMELELNHKTVRECFRPGTTNKIDIGDTVNNLLWRNVYSYICNVQTRFEVGANLGYTGWFDDGANFRITVTGGIITNIQNSISGGWA